MRKHLSRCQKGAWKVYVRSFMSTHGTSLDVATRQACMKVKFLYRGNVFCCIPRFRVLSLIQRTGVRWIYNVENVQPVFRAGKSGLTRD